MPNTTLASLGRLNDFLATQVAKKEVKDKEAIVNETGRRITQNFLNLGPNATVSDINKLSLQSIASASANGTLPQVGNIISTVANAQLNTKNYEGKAAAISALLEDSVYGAKASTLPTADAQLLYMQQKQSEEKSMNVIEDNKNYHVIYRQDKGMLVEAQRFNLGGKSSIQDNAEWDRRQTIMQRDRKELAADAASGKTFKSLLEKRVEANKILQSTSATIANRLKLPLEKLDKYPAGYSGVVDNLLWDPIALQKLAQDSEVTYDVQSVQDPDIHPMVAMEAKGKKYLDANGQWRTDQAAIPIGLQTEFFDFQTQKEIVDRLDKEIRDFTLDPAKVQGDTVQRALAVNRVADVGREIETILSDSVAYSKQYTYIEPLLRKLSNNAIDTPSEIWSSFTDQEKAQISIRLLELAQAQKNK